MQQNKSTILFLMISILIISVTSFGQSDITAISGEIKKWHKITLTFTGADTNYNPWANFEF